MKLILASLAVLAAQVAAIFNNERITHCTSDNWAETVENDDQNVWVITFYADWCPHCKTWDDELNLALSDARLANYNIKFGAVDVMANRDLTQRFGIKRSPTVKIFGLDKNSPEDYIGHRRHADVVDYCDEYCTEHGYIIVPVVSYIYNVDAVVKTIADAHEERIQLANAANKLTLSEIEQGYYTEVDSVKKDYDEQLQALITARSEALTTVGTEAQDNYNSAKKEHEDRVAELDKEAMEVIEALVQAHKDEEDLTEYVEANGKDWYNIEWNEYNRREITTNEVVPAPTPEPQPEPTPQPHPHPHYHNDYYGHGGYNQYEQPAHNHYYGGYQQYPQQQQAGHYHQQQPAQQQYNGGW